MKKFLAAACLSALCLPAFAAPGAVELRVMDPLRPIYGPEDAQATAGQDALRPVGPRNGFCSAQVIALGAPAGARATVGELRNGESVIPAEAVTIRYASKEAGYAMKLPDKGAHNFIEAYYDRLHPAPPAGADVLPIWVTVQVPQTARQGVYEGLLEFADVRLPVRLTVGLWICPPPNAWATHVGVVGSTEVLALHYGVDFWSDAHWALIEQQLKLLGALGNDDLWLHVPSEAGFREGLSNVLFTRKGDEIVPDLTVAARYMDLYARHVGRPQHVLVNLWNGRPQRRRGKPQGLNVFVDGKKEMIPLPADPGGARLWGSLMAGIRDLIKSHGWSEDIISLALAGDQAPTQQTLDAFQKYAPYAGWAVWTHGRADKPLWRFQGEQKILYANGMDVRYYVHPYTPAPAGWVRRPGVQVARGKLSDGIQGGWNQTLPIYASGRNDLHKYATPAQYRNFPNGMMLGYPEIGFGDDKGGAGFAFVWLDFWRIKGDTYWFSFQPFFCRLCQVMTRNNSPSLVEPGPDGPLVTVRYEMLREGLQETEARVVIERALLGGTLDDDLAGRCRAFLAQMIDVRFKGGKFTGGHAGSSLGAPGHMWGTLEYPAWQEATARLFNLTGEVAMALGPD